ncbi:MAG: radical SAM protein [bacterium]
MIFPYVYSLNSENIAAWKPRIARIHTVYLDATNGQIDGLLCNFIHFLSDHSVRIGLFVESTFLKDITRHNGAPIQEQPCRTGHEGIHSKTSPLDKLPLGKLNELMIIIPELNAWHEWGTHCLDDFIKTLDPASKLKDIEFIVPVTGENARKLSFFLENIRREADADGLVGKVRLCGVWNGTARFMKDAPEIEPCIANIEAWYKLSRKGHVHMSLQAFPLCFVPTGFLTLCEEISGESYSPRPGNPPRPAACYSCVLKSICSFFPLEVRTPGLLPVSSFANIPKRWRGTVAYSVSGKSEKCEIEVGGPCNNRCIDCPDKVFSRPTVQTRNLTAHIEDAQNRGVHTIVLTHGEPTIRKDFFHLLKVATHAGRHIIVETNGRALAIPGFTERLKEFNCLTFSVRLAGHDAETYCRFTGTDSYSQVFQGIENAARCGIPIELRLRFVPEWNDRLPEIFRTVFGNTRAQAVIIDIHPDWADWEGASTFSALMEKFESALQLTSSDRSTIPLFIEGIPICVLKNLQTLYRQKRHYRYRKPAICSACSLSVLCCGLPVSYISRFGTAELQPDFQPVASKTYLIPENELDDFTIEPCPIRNEVMASPSPASAIILHDMGRYRPYRTAILADNPIDFITTKILNGAVVESGRKHRQYRLCRECTECPRLHACAGCFDPVGHERKKRLASLPGKTAKTHVTLVVRSEAASYREQSAFGEVVSLERFLHRCLSQPEGKRNHEFVIFHDLIDILSSVEDFYDNISRYIVPEMEFVITGRQRMLIVGVSESDDLIPSIPPFTFAEKAAAAGLEIIGYGDLVQDGIPFWFLHFKKPVHPPRKPRNIKWACMVIERACVGNCIMCNAPHFFKNSRMYLPQVISLMRELKLNGFGGTDLIGGEIALRSDLDFLVSCCDAIGLTPNIISTGFRLNRDFFHRLMEAGLKQYSIGLDAPEPALNDFIKGARGIFSQTVAAIDVVTSMPGLDSGVNCVVLPENYPYLVDLALQVARAGIDKIDFFFCLSGPALAPVLKNLDKDQVQHFRQKILPDLKRIASAHRMNIFFHPTIPDDPAGQDNWSERIISGQYNLIYSNNDMICGAPYVNALIEMDGNVYPCMNPLLFGSPHIMGNINSNNLLRIFHSRHWMDFKNIAGKAEECKMCWGDNFIIGIGSDLKET